MAYASNDPAESRRIVRQSLISSATRLQQNDPKTPEEIIEIARIWEAYVYEGQPVAQTTAPPAVQYTSNGKEVTRGPTCAVCGNPLTEVAFKKGNTWPIDYLVQQGLSKYGQILCKAHYFGKKAPV